MGRLGEGAPASSPHPRRPLLAPREGTEAGAAGTGSLLPFSLLGSPQGPDLPGGSVRLPGTVLTCFILIWLSIFEYQEMSHKNSGFSLFQKSGRLGPQPDFPLSWEEAAQPLPTASAGWGVRRYLHPRQCSLRTTVTLSGK